MIGGVALIGAAAVSTFGHKTSDIIGATAAILPGAHTGDNAPIQSGHLIETAFVGTSGSIAVDAATIATEVGQARLGQNVIGGTVDNSTVSAGWSLKAGDTDSDPERADRDSQSPHSAPVSRA